MGDRLREARKEKRLSQEQVRARIGISQSLLSDLENNKSTATTYLQKLATLYGRHARWLEEGKGPKHLAESGHSALGDDMWLTVRGEAKLGSNGYYVEVLEAGTDGFVADHSTDPDAYALRVRGDSMFPALRSGWYVVVEPNGALAAGEYVAIAMRDGQKMVKEFLFRSADGITVQSINGGERLTIDHAAIETVHAIGAVLMPSKHREK